MGKMLTGSYNISLTIPALILTYAMPIHTEWKNTGTLISRWCWIFPKNISAIF